MTRDGANELTVLTRDYFGPELTRRKLDSCADNGYYYISWNEFPTTSVKSMKRKTRLLTIYPPSSLYRVSHGDFPKREFSRNLAYSRREKGGRELENSRNLVILG